MMGIKQKIINLFITFTEREDYGIFFVLIRKNIRRFTS